MATVLRNAREFQGKETEVWFTCSACTARIGDDRDVKAYKFCPNCGEEFDANSRRVQD